MVAPFQINLQQHERLQALYHLAVELSALRSLESVLDTALQHCLDLTGSQFGFIGLNTSDNRAMDVVAIQGFHPKQGTGGLNGSHQIEGLGTGFRSDHGLVDHRIQGDVVFSQGGVADHGLGAKSAGDGGNFLAVGGYHDLVHIGLQGGLYGPGNEGLPPQGAKVLAGNAL